MTAQYTDSDFEAPDAACDIIMKGGITSGVVYPLAITELAKHFRFANVGGTSAGAIAAAAAAAAEYGRHVPSKGFVRLAQLPEEVGDRLFSLFQPSPAVKPLFDIFVAAMGRGGLWSKIVNVIHAVVSGFRYAAAFGFVPGLVIAVAGCWRANTALVLLGLLLGLIGSILFIAVRIYRAIGKGIPDNDFGLCPGKSQPGNGNPGLTDWLADLIDDIAGRNPKKDPPLTFGDLSNLGSGADAVPRQKINLQMMTTNLTLRRPYSLPLQQKGYAFKRADFERLFPERIVTYLTEHCEKAEGPGEHDDLYKFPELEHLPIVVATRMSLSFPLLFCAVPLYARDFTLRKEERAIWRKNLFSDGGLSSNFPIHFFDRLLPTSPTFAISLDAYDEKRQRDSKSAAANGRSSRVWLPDVARASSGLLIPGQPFAGIVPFLLRLVDAAKDWQDNLQSTLAGYRDRIVHIDLKPDEGGLNINMPPGVVIALGDYGRLAGQRLHEEFNLDEHRWRRFLVAMTKLDETIQEFNEAYLGQDDAEPFESFLARYPTPPTGPLSYKQSAQDLKSLRDRAAALSKLADDWRVQSPIRDGKVPHPKTDFRISPRT